MTVQAYYELAPDATRYSAESPASELASLGATAAPAGVAVADGETTLTVSFAAPAADNVLYYQYSVRPEGGAAGGPVTLQPSDLTPFQEGGANKLRFTTAALQAYARYQVQVTAVGSTAASSDWSDAAVAGAQGGQRLRLQGGNAYMYVPEASWLPCAPAPLRLPWPRLAGAAATLPALPPLHAQACLPP